MVVDGDYFFERSSRQSLWTLDGKGKVLPNVWGRPSLHFRALHLPTLFLHDHPPKHVSKNMHHGAVQFTTRLCWSHVVSHGCEHRTSIATRPRETLTGHPAYLCNILWCISV